MPPEEKPPADRASSPACTRQGRGRRDRFRLAGSATRLVCPGAVRTAPKERQMSSTQTVDTKLEVVVVPVADAERAKRFYEGLGWRLDADFSSGEDWRGLQLTPPGSPCSIMIGKGVTTAVPGSAQGLLLVVDDIQTARAEFIEHGVDVSEVFHFEGPIHVTGTEGRAPGPDPKRASYASWASFSNPDGNGWLLQEVKTRLPGRGLGNRRRDPDRASARGRDAPRQVRSDGPEAPLVGILRRVRRRARAREDSRRGSPRCDAPHGRYPPLRAAL